MMQTDLLRKMKVSLDEASNEAQYELPFKTPISMNSLVGKHLKMEFSGEIICLRCASKTKKSFGEGLCYPCFRDSSNAAECILRPELCEAHLGKGRDPEWEEKHHNKPHYVYLSLTSGLKVGVTRATNVPSRWIDQGAVNAIILAETPYRQLAGEIEESAKGFVSDRTDWRKMLKNAYDREIDLLEEKNDMLERFEMEHEAYISNNDDIMQINYPVLSYPEKVKSVSFDKQPIIEGTLNGIKGQYLILKDVGVINIRKFSGYKVSFSTT